MEQKTTFLRFLITGISTLCLGIFSCVQEIEYRLDTEFVYINQSKTTVAFTTFDQSGKREDVSLEPSESIAITYLASGGYQNPEPNSCCQGILDSVLDGSDRGDIIVNFDDEFCRLNDPADITNYESEKIEKRYFRFKFYFTDAILENSKTCL